MAEGEDSVLRVKNAVERLRSGKMCIVIDGFDRENEGDIVLPAELITPEAINFMMREARGMICVPMTPEKASKLGLPLMTRVNADDSVAKFTISVDLISDDHQVTGVSAADRAATIRRIAESDASRGDFASPGHVFPLICHEGGLSRRAGHTEASVELLKIANLSPIAVICEVVKDDGSMARVPDLEKFAERHDLVILTIEDISKYIKHMQNC